VANDGPDRLSASDTACTGDPKDRLEPCLHGGELRVFTVPGRTSCDGLSATDALDAFQWRCDAGPSSVRFVSTGFRDGRQLSSLIDFSTLTWKADSVTVYDGPSPILTSSSSRWWSNPLIDAGVGGGLSRAGAVYVVRKSARANYDIRADRVALVVAPGETVTAPPGAESTVLAVLRRFLWIEGRFDARNAWSGVYFFRVNASVLRHVRADNAFRAPNINGQSGVYLYMTWNSRIEDLSANHNLAHGLELYYSAYNRVRGVTADDNGGEYGSYYSGEGVFLFGNSQYNVLEDLVLTNSYAWGLELSDAPFNTVRHVRASNNRFDGVHFYYNSEGSRLIDVVSTHNGRNGVTLSTNDDIVLSDITAIGNAYSGIYVMSNRGSILRNLIAANNGEEGVFIGGEGNTVENLVSADNGLAGLRTYQPPGPSYYTGIFEVGNNGRGAADDCVVEMDPSKAPTDPGFRDNCSPSADSDYDLYGGPVGDIDLRGTFTGLITSDSVNPDGENGSQAFSEIDDWFHFENPERLWGQSGAVLEASSRGQCAPGELCQVWDWSLRPGDTGDHGQPAALEVLEVPGESDVIAHTWYTDGHITCEKLPRAVSDGAGCGAVFLRDSIDLAGDWRAPAAFHDGLCQGGERCLHTPNAGAYQGHGTLEPLGSIGGTSRTIELYGYLENGREE
jgi:parallel beta-helix repeat protein